jgi:hypothetical protein
LAEGRRSGTVKEVCIKEHETDCARLVVQYVKKNETVRKIDERMRRRRLNIRAE